MKRMIFLILAILLTFSTAQAVECSGSGTTKLITYSPADLNVGEVFNLTYYDLFGGANELATLNFPQGLVIVEGNRTVTLQDDGLGGGYYTWRMNSTAPGNYTVFVNISYEGTCEVTRNITIQPTLFPPELQLSLNVSGWFKAGQIIPITLQIANIGTGTAYNVSGWTNFGSIADQFFYPQLEAGNSTSRNFNVQTTTCGIHSLNSVANYKDEFGYSYPPATTNRELEVKGSDLVIEEFEASKDSVEEGKHVEFKIKIKNKARSTSIEAEGVKVKFYQDNKFIKEIELGSIGVNESKQITFDWKAVGTGTIKIKAVVSASFECSNWNNNEKSIDLKIKESVGEKEEELPEEQPEQPQERKEEAPTYPPELKPEIKKMLLWPLILIIAIEVVALILVLLYLRKRAVAKVEKRPGRPKKRK